MAVGPIEHGAVKSAPNYGAEAFEGEAVNGADVFYVDAGFRRSKVGFQECDSVRFVVWNEMKRISKFFESGHVLTSVCCAGLEKGRVSFSCSCIR